jgi:hypothetical protein
MAEIIGGWSLGQASSRPNRSHHPMPPLAPLLPLVLLLLVPASNAASRRPAHSTRVVPSPTLQAMPHLTHFQLGIIAATNVSGRQPPQACYWLLAKRACNACPCKKTSVCHRA